MLAITAALCTSALELCCLAFCTYTHLSHTYLLWADNGLVLLARTSGKGSTSFYFGFPLQGKRWRWVRVHDLSWGNPSMYITLNSNGCPMSCSMFYSSEKPHRIDLEGSDLANSWTRIWIQVFPPNWCGIQMYFYPELISFKCPGWS